MRRLTLAALVGFASSIAVLTAQSPGPARFEVASVKPDPKQDRGGPQSIGELTLSVVRVLPGGRVESIGRTLRHLIAWTYEISVGQEVVGKQDILEMEFNISAKAAADSLTATEARAMIRTLLEERFQLKGRMQPREIDGYVLMPAREDRRPGPGLRPFTGNCAARANNPSVPFESPDYEAQKRCGWTGINGRYRAVGLSMPALAQQLMFFMQAPVSDRTGWTGLFTFDVLADVNDMPITVLQRATLGGRGSTIDAPPMLDVFRSELGVRVVKERTTINDFVVDRVEPLIEN